uniref:Ig-like domain-containing protein n=1 Tax=Lepisosteus oculatus TaxID=7918 RepID=W5LXH9_LEPOC
MLTVQVLVALVSVTLVQGGAVFSQSPSVVPVSLGDSVTLECSVKGDNVNRINVRWIRQTPGKQPEGVVKFNSDNKIYRPSAIPDRFVPSRDESKNSYLLTVSNIQEGDDSVYFCFMYYTDGEQTWGEGTRIKVLKSGLPPPVLQLFPPPTQEVSANGSVTVTCLLSGFYPGFVDVSWSVDGAPVTSGVHSAPVWLDSANAAQNTYVTSSSLSLPAAEWQTHALYSCIAKHESSPTPVIASITPQGC